LIFALHEHREGGDVGAVGAVVYDLGADTASRAPAHIDGAAVVWTVGEDAGAPVLTEDVEPGSDWLVRCDRIDFPPGGVAYRHDHPGPGIRRLLFGELTIESEHGTRSYGPGEAWFEDAGYPVLATASATEATAFVRVLLLPPEFAGRRTIRYLDPADEQRPKLQRATVLLEEPLAS
jgi:quercetin dioxygenase-like cupin family protein